MFNFIMYLIVTWMIVTCFFVSLVSVGVHLYKAYIKGDWLINCMWASYFAFQTYALWRLVRFYN